MDRRGFIKLVLGAAAGFHLTPVPWHLINDVGKWTQNWPWVPRSTRMPNLAYAHTVCTLCKGGCGIKVRLVDAKRSCKVEGQAGAPVNQGKVCPIGAAGPQYQYSPSRYLGPLKRVGARGSGAYAPITWSDAVKEIGAKLVDLRKQGLAHTVVMITGRKNTMIRQLSARFMAAYGSPNLVDMPSVAGSWDYAVRAQFGVETGLGYDLEKSRMVLSFGCALIEGWGSPVRTIQAFSRWRSSDKVKFVQIDTRGSITASKADQLVAVNPGTESALALGLAHVIIKDGLYNKDFVAKYAFGFDEFQTMVLKDYSPNQVALITGVPENVIVALAREFAKTEKALALAGKGKGAIPSQVYELMAVMALNALVGNINQPGGVIVKQDLPLAKWPEAAADKIAQTSLAVPRLDQAGGAKYPLTRSLLGHLTEAIRTGGQYPVNALIIDQANPAFFGSDPSAFRAALGKVPLVVGISSMADDTTIHADIILPEASNFEGPADVLNPPTLPYPLFGMGKGLVKSRYNTKPAGDIYLTLAKAIGAPVSDALPFKTHADMLKAGALGLLQSKRGLMAKVNGPLPEEIFGAEIKPASFADEKAFAKALEDGVFWYDPAFKYGDMSAAFQTPSRKFEFLSQSIQMALAGFIAEKGSEAAMAALGQTRNSDLTALPHFEPIISSKPNETFPLTLVPVEQFKLVTDSLGNAPYLTKLLEDLTLKGGKSVVDVHPHTAEELHLHEGDRAWLETPKGRQEVLVHLFEGARPGVVYAPVGLGHVGFDLYLRDKGSNVLEIVEAKLDPLSGEALYWATKANLMKA
ncbi:MAG: molybdopterin-dependent oxidoreductase [Deltaproteobacteria bacterium]|nr:molybdopterin-dependent oxidoreductase [Deltaproteobacteria bacterium]